MDTATLSAQVATIRATLHSIENELDRGRIPPQGLDDFKAAVDDIRLRVWNIMAAGKSPDYDTALERFRVRRAAEITRAMAEDLVSGAIGWDHPELQDLRVVAGTLANAIPIRR